MLIPSAIVSSVLTYLGTQGEVLLCWLVMSTVDCMAGIIVAVTSSTFKTSKLFRWVGKVFMELLLVVLLAMLCRVVNITLGIEQFLSNWILLFFILLDFSSICNKLLYFGILPTPFKIILKYLRHNFAKSFSVMLNTPGAMEELEKALEQKDQPSVAP